MCLFTSGMKIRKNVLPAAPEVHKTFYAKLCFGSRQENNKTGFFLLLFSPQAAVYTPHNKISIYCRLIFTLKCEL